MIWAFKVSLLKLSHPYFKMLPRFSSEFCEKVLDFALSHFLLKRSSLLLKLNVLSNFHPQRYRPNFVLSAKVLHLDKHSSLPSQRRNNTSLQLSKYRTTSPKCGLRKSPSAKFYFILCGTDSTKKN